MKYVRNIWPDSILLSIIVLLTIVGMFVFMSASFGLLAREGAGWSSVLFSQIVLGLGGGLVLGLIAYMVPVSQMRRLALFVLVFSILLCIGVFIPGLGFRSGGATRWIHMFGFSFQPSELLKLSLVLFLASWMSSLGEEIKVLKSGLLPFIGIITITGGLILAEPDTGTFLVILVTAMSMFLVAGGRIKHVGIMLLCAVVLLSALIIAKPYVKERILTFFDPTTDPLGSSYQIRQVLLAIGSGGVTGRGFGQSLQKFQYLPEPIGDSVFAVVGEEFGFVGTTVIILLFLSFFLRCLTFAGRGQTKFNRLLGFGIVIMISAQAFLHIGAMVGIFPLTGVPLPFVSHGGTALMVTLIASGILLQVSRNQKQI